ncbi:MAG: anthranilate synthase component I family protein [Myxococcales bacterium]|nr:anthranilate synthase component I family protein [Myxococcales bacterium]
MTLGGFSRTYVADALTPVSAYARLRAADPDGASLLFESVVGGERWGRYSILAYRPGYEAILGRRGWHVRGPRAPSFDLGADAGRDPLQVAAPLFRTAPGAAEAPLPLRLAASHFGFFAWDLVHLVDKVPPGDPRTWDAHEIALAHFLGSPVVVVFDSLAQTYTIAAASEAELARCEADLAREAPLGPVAIPDRGRIDDDVRVDTSDADYHAMVRRAQEYIAAGDAFQVVLARTFSVPRAGRDPFDVYRALRLLNPSPYMYFLDMPPVAPGQPRTQIAGASPETMVRLEGGRMTVRPIAGTRPRGRTEAEDRALEAELLADPKERAEHVMLIDLGRNDVGRVAKTGSVELVRRMEIDRFSHVMHIVSEVSGQVPAATPRLDVVRAAFPAGTLSGAPKVRAMQIIRELEARPRNVYGGAVGYVSPNGDLDFAIAIRTAVCKGDVIEVTAGAGVVEASDPRAEADETRNKARGVLCAVAALPRR